MKVIAIVMITLNAHFVTFVVINQMVLVLSVSLLIHLVHTIYFTTVTPGNLNFSSAEVEVYNISYKFQADYM